MRRPKQQITKKKIEAKYCGLPRSERPQVGSAWSVLRSKPCALLPEKRTAMLNASDGGHITEPIEHCQERLDGNRYEQRARELMYISLDVGKPWGDTELWK
jgi:hypothetical protein